MSALLFCRLHNIRRNLAQFHFSLPFSCSSSSSRVALPGFIYYRPRQCSTISAKKRRIGRVLVANRAEIALRVMRAARQIGITSIAVYSDADTNSLHTQFADEAYHIGEASAAKSYLNAERIVEVAKSVGADAIHPGYGFLSENADFAERCAAHGIVFIGPSPEAIRAMGMKNMAKRIMIQANVPVVKGYNGAEQGTEHLLDEARQIGFPVMIKAVSGGGGKGMRICETETQFLESLQSARSEAQKAFGNSDMILEQYIRRPRHVEVQIFGDHHGNYVHLWERDCSTQRRHQKIIEEAPAPGLSLQTRQKLGGIAVDAARAVGYVGAGTVEFIMDTADGQFYFMEMNTRLQVEHPITEAITGIDLVQWQFLVAQDEPIPLSQDQIPLKGHAIEARIYAEDSEAGFMPTAGVLEHLEFPDDLRVDSGVREGDTVSVHYDPMIAKVIAAGADRNAAIRRLDNGLRQLRIGGLCNNVRFVRACLGHERFRSGDVYTDLIAEHMEELKVELQADQQEMLIEAAMAHLLLLRYINGFNGPSSNNSPFTAEPAFFRLNHFAIKKLQLDPKTVIEMEIGPTGRYKVQLDANGNKVYKDVRVTKVHFGTTPITGKPLIRFSLEVDGKKQWECRAVLLAEEMVVYGPNAEHKWSSPMMTLQSADGVLGPTLAIGTDGKARSPMPGVVEKVLVREGDRVAKGQPMAAINAMKMEFIIRAHFDGIVESICCSPGDNVAKDMVLVELKKVDEQMAAKADQA